MADNLDDDINNDADAWEKEHHKTERHKADLRHKRRTAVGRFFKRTFVAFVGVAVLVGVVGGSYYGISSCIARSNAEDARELVQEKALDLFYEEQWIKCLDTLGREQCEIIQEIGLHKCEQRGSVNTTPGYKLCTTERFDARYERIKPVEQEEVQ